MITYERRAGGAPITPRIVEAMVQGLADASTALGRGLAVDATTKLALHGCEVLQPSAQAFNLTPGWVWWAGELLRVVVPAQPLVANGAGICSLYVASVVLDGTVVGLEDNPTPVPQLMERVLVLDLTNNVPAGAAAFGVTELTYLAGSLPCPGDVKDWRVPAGKQLEDFFEMPLGKGKGRMRGWALAMGQTVDGVEIPDQRGLVRIGAGQLADRGDGQPGANYLPGQRVGAESVVLLEGQMPKHTHTGGPDSQGDVPEGEQGVVMRSIANPPQPTPQADTLGSGTELRANIAPQHLAAAGNDEAHENRQPSRVWYTVYRYL